MKIQIIMSSRSKYEQEMNREGIQVWRDDANPQEIEANWQHWKGTCDQWQKLGRGCNNLVLEVEVDQVNGTVVPTRVHHNRTEPRQRIEVNKEALQKRPIAKPRSAIQGNQQVLTGGILDELFPLTSNLESSLPQAQTQTF